MELSAKYELSAIIIAGGKSSRMGKDKRLVHLLGESLIERSIKLAESFSSDIVISSNDHLAEYKAYKVIPDRDKDQGPLAGLISALPEINNSLCIVLSCDMPNVSVKMVEKLVSSYSHNRIVLYATEKMVQPFPALIPNSIMKDLTQKYRENERSIKAVYQSLPHTLIQPDDAKLSSGFLNINQPGDIEKAMKIVDDKDDPQHES